MNENVVDDALKRVYRPFERNHAQGRSKLLESISNLPEAADNTVVSQKRQRLIPVALSLAVVLLVGMTLAVTFWPPGAPRAGAVEEARRQLLEVRSLHLKGWMFQTIEKDGKLQVEQFPTEFYAVRPCRYWSNGYGFSFEGNHKLVNVTHSHTASDGKRSIWVSHDQRLALVTPVSRLESELQTEQLLQQKVFDQLLTGLPDSYRRIGDDEIGGIRCDVYERDEPPQEGFGQRSRLWLNATSGMPVRLKVWSRLRGRPEEPHYEYDMIEINGSPPEGMFPLAAPEGFHTQIVEGEPGPITLPEGACASGGGMSMGGWIPFNIDDRAVLYCWWIGPPSDEKGLPNTPEFSLGPPRSNRPCQVIPLRKDDKWNWSLLVPENDQRIGLDEQVSVVLKSEKAHLENTFRPLRISNEKLERILLEAQQASISPDSGIEPFTLKEIAEMLILFDRESTTD
jgi:hypothetical protein